MKYISLILLLFMVAHSEITGPVSYYGNIQASGSYMRSSKTGNIMQVKGVSFFWSQWQDGYRFYNENAVDHMAQSWKAEIVRAAYGAANIISYIDTSYIGDSISSIDTVYYSFNDSIFVVNRERIETIVDAAIKNNIYVIIDWHSHSAHNAYETENAKQFFSYYAEKYGHLDNVIFELYNEPNCFDGTSTCTAAGRTTWPQIKTYAEAVIPSIREHSDNLILVGTPYYSQNIDHVVGNAIDDHNLGYVLHFYAASHSLSSFETNIAKVRSAGLPIFVTEFGTTNADGGNPSSNNYDSHSTTSTDSWLNFFNGRGISYVAWSISDKYEGSAFFGIASGVRFDQTIPENWTDTTLMSASGAYIFKMLLKNYETAAWNPEATPILNNGKTLNTKLQAANNKVYLNIGSSGNASLNVYSLNGILVKTLFSGHLNTGSHQFAMELPKGAYILKLSHKNEVFTNFVIKK